MEDSPVIETLPVSTDINKKRAPKIFRNAVTFYMLFTFIASVVLSYFLVGNNTKLLVAPTIAFALFFLFALFKDQEVASGENAIGFNTDAAVICGIAVISAISNSPLSFILAISVFIIYPVNIRKKQWAYLLLNFSNMILAGIACYTSLRILDISASDGYLKLLPAILVASLCFEFFNYFFLTIYFIVEHKKWNETKELLHDLRNNLIQTIPLAVICGVIGRYYLEVGAVALLGYVIPLIIGPEIYSSYARLMSSKKSSVRTLIYALEEKDPYTGGHVERVAMFARYIGEELNYKPFRQNRLYQAALLHDMGKLIVPSALLNKPGKLTDDEFAIVKKHEGVTEEILSDISFLKAIAHTAGGDHNHMDTNAKIKYLEPYIVSVCDAFDAMTSSRSYRKALSQEIAFEELRNNSGKQFHGEVVEALIRAIEKRDEHYGAGYEENIIHEDAPEAGLGSAGLGDTIKGEENA